MHRRTASLPWDDLDAGTCGPDGTPDWHSMTVAGPVRRTDRQGRVSLQWVVTVDCGSAGRPDDRADG